MAYTKTSNKNQDKDVKYLSKDFNKILEESYGVGAEKTYSEAKARLVGKGKGKFRTPGSEDFMGLVKLLHKQLL